MVGVDRMPRSVPASMFIGAPRFHMGGGIGLQSHEVPIIAQRGERMLSRRQVQGAGQSAPITIHMHIQTPDVHRFRQTQSQILNDMQRRVARIGGRNS